MAEPHTIVLNPVGLFGNRSFKADNNEIVFSGRGVNNSGILSGSEQHIIVVRGDDANEVREYTKALGTTSLYEALRVFANIDSSSSIQKAKALEDLIFIRLILSGSIQFKEPSLLGLFQTVVGNKFKKLPENSRGGIDVKESLVEKLLSDLDEGKKDVTVIKQFITLISLTFGAGALPTFFSLQFSGSMMGMSEAIFLSNLNLMYPIIIGILASMTMARYLVNHENNIYTIALVKLIDRFLSSNTMILDIINDPESGFGLPKPLRGNQLGMALYFKYIRQIQEEARRIQIEKDTAGENGRGAFLSFNKFIGDGHSGNSQRGGKKRRTRQRRTRQRRYKRRSTRKA